MGCILVGCGKSLDPDVMAKAINLRFLIFIILGGLLSCSTPPRSETHSNSGVHPNKALAPIWEQTEYIFYNKTGSPVTVVLVEEGKARKKDGTVIRQISWRNTR